MRNGFCFLCDKLPNAFKGRDASINLDTRTCTAVAIILKTREACSNEEKAFYSVAKLFHMNYSDVLARTGCDSETLDRFILDYLNGYPEAMTWAEMNEKTPVTEVSRKGDKTPDFDFIQDSDAIITGFRQVYGMGLDDVCNCHWWEFLALLRNLPAEGNMFNDVRNLRNRKPSKTDTPEMKQELAKAQRSVRLKDTRTPEQKDRDRAGIFDNID